MELHARVAFEKKDYDMAERCAATLEELGLTVASITERGIGFIGDKEQIETAFQTEIEKSPLGEVHFEHEPILPFRNGDKDNVNVYFPRQVVLF